MKAPARHRIIWRTLARLTRGWLTRKFAFTPERSDIGAPCLVVSNHVTNWDPLLIALSFPESQMYYVASEHVFRMGALSRAIKWLVDPIPRSKAASGVDTVRECMRRIRAGGSVCLFAEGDCTWNGISGEVFPATGKLAKLCGAALVTYRLEGGYLTLPRWGKGVRRGAMRGHAVNVYSPEALKAMSASGVNAAINRDIYEDAWARQRQENTQFCARALAENLEKALFICPGCGKLGALSSRGDSVRCASCGFERKITPAGTFEPREPFENIAHWDAWQRERMADGGSDFYKEGFSDAFVTLSEITAGHSQKELCSGELRGSADGISCAGQSFDFADIADMSMITTKRLLFSARSRYYELRAEKPCCLRKYLMAWQCFERPSDI